MQYDYSQNDIRWRDEPLGFSTWWKIGNSGGQSSWSGGCLITSAAMAASYLGHVINPSEMNRRCKQAGVINAEGDIVRDDFVTRIFPDIKTVDVKNWPTQPADLRFFDIRNDLTTEILVKIDSQPAAGLQSHFLRVIGWDGGKDIIVVDPWDGKRKGLSAYAARHSKDVPRIVYKAIKLHRQPPPALTSPAPPPDPKPAPAPPPVSKPAPAPDLTPAPAADPLLTFTRLDAPLALQYAAATSVWDLSSTAGDTLTPVSPVPKGGKFTAVGMAVDAKGRKFYMSSDVFGEADKTGKPLRMAGVLSDDVMPFEDTARLPDKKKELKQMPWVQIVMDVVSILTAVGGVIGLFLGLLDDVAAVVGYIGSFWAGKRSHRYVNKRR